MRFTLFNALQIFKLTVKLTIQPASVEAERTFGACGLFTTTPQSMRCASHEMRCQSTMVWFIVSYHSVDVKNAWFSSYMQRWL